MRTVGLEVDWYYQGLGSWADEMDSLPTARE